MPQRDRLVGCVVGLALGDGLGAPFVSRRARDIPRPLPALELSGHLPPGGTTDATAMARNLVRSLAARGVFDADDLIVRHLEWARSGSPHIGALTRRVLARVEGGTRAQDAARAVWEERGPEVSAGNGSVMYCAPLGAAYAFHPDALRELAPALSALTQFDPRCGTAVLAVCLAAAAAVRGEPRMEAVRAAVEAVIERDGGEELEYLVEAAGEARPVDGPDQGFCLYAAALGLQALAREGSFEEELARVVGLGGDTNTNAAVAGALVGATVGRARLPEGWLDRLVDRAGIEEEARALVDATPRSGGDNSPGKA